ncbi:hypothetical protein UFOVP972_24 [uncultured Caudovirales phage]|jgi:hypothetical protein|uniref:Uncharacterized protein n=1 Tax=uncultured Caudovirales phage TaxID=2100421 RepID=A0A6J5Q3T0_9CAUD|nr:hypothetical protein UFOVP972_24 [uncultured Caudovirales phage]
MKNTIVIGPIQKAKPVTERASILDNRLSKMKVGNFFEIVGLSNKTDLVNFRASINYFSKKNNVKVATTLVNGVLVVERVKSSKTKEVSEVK